MALPASTIRTQNRSENATELEPRKRRRRRQLESAQDKASPLATDVFAAPEELAKRALVEYYMLSERRRRAPGTAVRAVGPATVRSSLSDRRHVSAIHLRRPRQYRVGDLLRPSASGNYDAGIVGIARATAALHSRASGSALVARELGPLAPNRPRLLDRVRAALRARDVLNRGLAPRRSQADRMFNS